MALRLHDILQQDLLLDIEADSCCLHGSISTTAAILA